MFKTTTAATCPYCKERILAGIDIAVCSICETVQHKSCWDTHGQCSVYGCSGNTLLFPRPKFASIRATEALLLVGSIVPFFLLTPFVDFIMSHWFGMFNTAKINAVLWVCILVALYFLWQRVYICPVCNYPLRFGWLPLQKESICPKCGVRLLSIAGCAQEEV